MILSPIYPMHKQWLASYLLMLNTHAQWTSVPHRINQPLITQANFLEEGNHKHISDAYFFRFYWQKTCWCYRFHWLSLMFLKAVITSGKRLEIMDKCITKSRKKSKKYYHYNYTVASSTETRTKKFRHYWW